MSKIEITNLTKNQLDETYLKNISEKILKILDQGQKIGISLVIVDRNRMRSLNKKYRGKNQVTDVLSFPFQKGARGKEKFIEPLEEIQFLGEIIICYPQAKKQAKEFGHSLQKELTIILIHGILHLIGYHHG